MLKKKFVGIVVVLSTLVVILTGTTVAFATGAIDIKDLIDLGSQQVDDKASLEIISSANLKRRIFDPKSAITNVTDPNGNSVDPSEVDMTFQIKSSYYGNDSEWIDVPSEEMLDADGNISVTNFYNNEMHRLVRITYRYSYKLPVSRFGTSENIIEKTSTFYSASI
ncbi:hypothetical protein [Enterococcus caccae]|uniref:Uncharacterized protein n=1 Tax=Enterococcus caccae ATCC BAA-1240 TaxID=1158612 RepID=R3TP93_9ENTE|nr:hypothetical protein [Enterococcus caccae]EOL43349.1 hypothetical protein UC7_02678 [Enterococcus caccae ATCC BAA-1240]EOT68251.1 hypothetical protein I580_00634 [Enterococcus caccae ATCC BAA-1240]OJG26882.1 hypothetical protein RU98_GL002973 [Enterococcus caccae]